MMGEGSSVEINRDGGSRRNGIGCRVPARLKVGSGKGMATTQQRLRDLATQEEALLERVRELMAGTGRKPMSWQEQRLAENGVFAEYGIVHREYVELALAGDLEALKRALFLQWFEVAEPSCFTGIRNLDTQARLDVFVHLERECAAKSLDPELEWMLPYYYAIAEYYMPLDGSFPALTAFCEEHYPHGEVPLPTGDVFRGRGQMGHYWENIRSSQSRWR